MFFSFPITHKKHDYCRANKKESKCKYEFRKWEVKKKKREDFD